MFKVPTDSSVAASGKIRDLGVGVGNLDGIPGGTLGANMVTMYSQVYSITFQLTTITAACRTGTTALWETFSGQASLP